MTVYEGNHVSYGSAGTWWVETEVTNTPATTASTVNVTVTRRVQFTQSISDSSNTGSWTGPDGSGTYNNTNYSSGSGTTFTVHGPVTFAATVVYGGGNTLNFTQTADGMASGSTGPSSLNVNYPLPARVASPPNAPAAPTTSNLTPVGARVSWTIPGTNGSAITGYQVQVDDSSGFGSPVISTTDSASPYDATGLTPGTTYYARVRANSAAGWSSWSSASSPFQTLPALRVGAGGVWRWARVHVGAGGVWRQTRVRVGAGGVWRG